MQVETPVGGTVPATLSLTLGAPATFGAFTPGVAREYTASTTANVISTALDATLTVEDMSRSRRGGSMNGTFALAQPLQVSAGGEYGPVPRALKSWVAPVSNDPVTLGFRQAIGANDRCAPAATEDAHVHAVDDEPIVGSV